MKPVSSSLFSILMQGEETARSPASLTPVIEKTLSKTYGFQHIAGIDEAGRGPLAGPVVAAAVIFPLEKYPKGIQDSKRLSPRKRETLYDEICMGAAAIGIGVVGPEKIDILNIRQATLLAMKKAVISLSIRPDFCIVDGVDEIPYHLPQSPLVGGDRRCLSVAAASILAKVTRDRIMVAYHKIYPAYGFNQNMGYGTKQHREALKCLGPSPIHRRTFRGVVKL